MSDKRATANITASQKGFLRSFAPSSGSCAANADFDSPKKNGLQSLLFHSKGTSGSYCRNALCVPSCAVAKL